MAARPQDGAVDMNATKAVGGLLLLDLDGVVVFESGPPLLEALEILRLHDGLTTLLDGLDMPVVVLTHRSRREAAQILQAAGVEVSRLGGIMAAEELLRAGLKHGGVAGVVRHGLRKSWILPLIEERFGISRKDIAFIDDRLENLQDLLAHGLGLALHAPSDVVAARRALVSFDFAEALERIAEWREGRLGGGIVALPAREYSVLEWRRTGLHTRRQGRHVFNMARRVGRAMRETLRLKRAT